MYKIGIIPNIRIPTNCFLEDDTTDDKQVFTDDEIALLMIIFGNVTNKIIPIQHL